MEKAVLLSIQRKYVELILSGNKWLEVRKNKPTIKTPFRCYIYETRKDGGRGMVVAKFVCDSIVPVEFYCSDPSQLKPLQILGTGLTDTEIIAYLGNGKSGFAWHISELIAYNFPLHLSFFCGACDFKYRDGDWCELCKDEHWDEGITKAPQSWRYVEVLE